MKKILVVDDDQSILDAISLILDDSGYKVYSTLRGQEAIEKIEEYSPDLVLLDVLLSGVDGRDISRKIKENPRIKKTRVVMISAHPSASTDFKKYKADDFLPKPFGLEELLNIVKKHLSN